MRSGSSALKQDGPVGVAICLSMAPGPSPASLLDLPGAWEVSGGWTSGFGPHGSRRPTIPLRLCLRVVQPGVGAAGPCVHFNSALPRAPG